MSTLPYLTGIQQAGIGVADLDVSWKWYRKVFDMRVPVFDDAGTAELMTRYTNGIPEERRAVLALNMAGGGGFEIWQYTNRLPVAPAQAPRLGDLGIYALKIKAKNVPAFHELLAARGIATRPLVEDPLAERTFWMKDPWGNRFQLVHGQSWFDAEPLAVGGVCGAVIGVSDMDRAVAFYTQVLGIREIVYDRSGVFADLPEATEVRRVLLRKVGENFGAFSRLLGNTRIELIQRLDGQGLKIFEGRCWGDRGFIHLCFDAINLEGLKNRAESMGHAFTVDSDQTFRMGKAGGRFAYLEDPDGTLIELVETHKVPLFKPLGLYLDLQRRGMYKVLPDWMLRIMGWSKRND
ncbi:MAG: hypothetical protein RLZZ617_1327 [Bacteroidota bacterium]|nr:VOC family protein [Sphingobacteriia bacterium]